MTRALWVLGLLLAAALPAGATDRVIFGDGRELRVQGIVLEGDSARLLFPDGGSLSVPLSSVVSVEPIVAPPADVAPAAGTPTAEQGESSARILEMASAYERQEGWRTAAGAFADLLAAAADRNGVGRSLLAAVAQVESGFDAKAVSRKGALGLMQLLPETAKRFGVSDPFDPGQSAEGGARYLRWLMDRYDGRLDLALAGYNAGEGAVDRHSAIPPYRETLGYVVKVLKRAVATASPAP